MWPWWGDPVILGLALAAENGKFKAEIAQDNSPPVETYY
jgi:hypothetical protein